MAALAGGAAAIACAPIFVRLALAGGVGPVAIAFWRLALAVPPLGLWLAWHTSISRRRGLAAPDRAPWLRLTGGLALAGLFFAADLGVWHVSIRFTKVANATLLANFAPVFVTLGAWALWGQRPRRLFLAGLAAALTGAALLLGGSLQLSARFVTGDALGLLTAVFYGGYLLTVSRLRTTGRSVVEIMFWASAAAAGALLPAVLMLSEPLRPPSAGAWWPLIGLALVSQVGGQGLIAYALAHLPAAFSSVTLLLQPVLAALFAWAWLGEGLGLLHLAGGAIVLAGIVLARLGSLPAGRQAE
ncbi:MAG: DMT family transporter [Candidatus Sumerlaeia bacterium]